MTLYKGNRHAEPAIGPRLPRVQSDGATVHRRVAQRPHRWGQAVRADERYL